MSGNEDVEDDGSLHSVVCLLDEDKIKESHLPPEYKDETSESVHGHAPRVSKFRLNK